MPVFNVARGVLRRQIARGFGDLPFSSGSLANPQTTTFHSPVLVFGDDNQLVGGEVSFYSGGGASEADSARLIYAATPYSPASASLYGRVDALQPWVAAPSTNSAWEIHKLFTRQQYDDAITRAVRRVARRQLLSCEEYHVAGTTLRNAAFDRWSLGVSAVPDQWDLSGSGSATIAQTTGDIYQGRFAVALTSDGTNLARISQTVPRRRFYAGQTVTLHGLVLITVASRAFVSLSDGVTDYDSGFHPGTSGGDGLGQYRHLEVEAAMPSNPTNVIARFVISAGSAQTGIVGKIWLSGLDVHEYDLEQNWAFIQDVYIEGTRDEFILVPREWWYINKDRSPRELVFIEDYFTPEAGKVIKVVGQQYPTDPAEGENLPVDPEYVLNRASADLYSQLPGGSADWRGWATKYREWEARAQQIEAQMHTKPYPGSVAVEDL